MNKDHKSGASSQPVGEDVIEEICENCGKKYLKHKDRPTKICGSCKLDNYIADGKSLSPSKEVAEESAIEILKELCQLKHYKDTVGKDAFYERRQPELWKEANDYLNKVASSSQPGEAEAEKAIELLKDYEQWEADLISNDDFWWPKAPKDSLSGKVYEKMLELQQKRNEILKRFKHNL